MPLPYLLLGQEPLGPVQTTPDEFAVMPAPAAWDGHDARGGAPLTEGVRGTVVAQFAGEVVHMDKTGREVGRGRNLR